MTARKLPPKQQVLRKWPRSWSYWSSLYGEWRIQSHMKRFVTARTIAYGYTAAEAWRNAAEKLKCAP